MKRTPLRRYTPLKAKAPLRRGSSFLKRTPLAKKSDKQKERDAKYSRIAKAWLALPGNEWCKICIARGKKPNPATEVHHRNGRAGELLFDTRYFVPSCYPCRLWPHDNSKQARELGLLGTFFEWNTTDKNKLA